MIGQTVDQYKIAQSLGRNPIAETFLGEHVVSGELFVLKMVTPQLLVLAGFKDRLMADASNMIDWHHPRVLPLENILDDGGRLFLVQRFVESESLAKILRDHTGAFPLPDFNLIAADILNALEYLHHLGHVPRFLNPRKIMVQPDGHAFLRDMGGEFSKAVETYRKNQNLVPAARFYAPERFENADTLDVRHNIYSMGIILFQMATGKIPYGGNTFEELQERHSSSRIPSPIKVNPALGEALSSIILKAMAKRPEDRFQSVEELRNALGLPAEDSGGGTMVNAVPFGLPALDDHDFGFDMISEKQAEQLSEPTPSSLDPVGEDTNPDARPSDFGFEFGGKDGHDFGDPGNKPFEFSGSSSDSFDLGLDNTAGGGEDLDDDFNLGTPSGIINLDDAFGEPPKRETPPPAKAAAAIDGASLSSAPAPAGFGNLDADTDLDFGNFGSDQNDPFGFASTSKPAKSDDEFQFDAGGGFGDSSFEFDNDPLGAGPEIKIGAPTQASDAFEQSASSGSYSLGELDSHDPNALEAAFERELHRPQNSDPFGSLDIEDEEADPYSALGVDRDQPPEPDPGGDEFGLGDDMDATNPDEGFNFKDPSPSASPAAPNLAAASGDDFELEEPDDFAFPQTPSGYGTDDAFTRGGADPFADDVGFGFEAPAPAQTKPFGFDSGKDDLFSFADEPAQSNAFSLNDDLGGDDFGFDSPPKSDNDDFGFGGGSKSDNDDFGFGAPTSGGNFSFDNQPAAENVYDFGTAPADDDFNFAGPGGGFGFEDPKVIDDDFGFDTPGDQDDFGFGGPSPGSKAAPAQAANAFNFDKSGSVDEFGLPWTSDAFDTPPAASARPAGPKANQGFGTEDGAFSFEAVEEVPQPPPATASALAGSLAAAERSVSDNQATGRGAKVKATAKDTDKGKGKPKAKVVRKFDLRIVGVTVGLAALVVAAVTFWFISSQRKKHDQEVITEINRLVQNNDFETALSRIKSELGQKPSSSLENQLNELGTSVAAQQADMKKQVGTLMERALEYENDGRQLVDGVNDALGTYARILAKAPNNKDAESSFRRIKSTKMEEVDSLLTAKNEMKALSVLSALVEADSSDRKAREKLNDLKQQLAEVKVGELTTQLEKLFAAQRFPEMVEPLQQLTQITPDAKFVKEMRNTLIVSLGQLAQQQASRQQFDNAEKTYQMITALDPKDISVQSSLTAVREQRLVSQIQSKQVDLTNAINRKNLREQFQLANELSKLDPGNFTANSALSALEKTIMEFLRDADALRESGQYRKAADRYKEVYDINGDKDVYALYDKYAKWTPPAGMAIVPRGEYRRGDDRTGNARPAHQVYVGTFFIDKTEVTNRQFEEFVVANPEWGPARIDPRYHDGKYLKHWIGNRPVADDMDRPVVFVSWYAARQYAIWRKKRLPTEAEWEKAARGATQRQKYWWGDHSDAKKAVYELFPEHRPTKVGSFPANDYGIYEILGNVNEWVEDTYDPEMYFKTRDAKNPVNSINGAEKVLRGGSFKSRGKDLEVFQRFYRAPNTCNETIGFRCARDAAAVE